MSEAPAISVRAAQTRPRVQLSATATRRPALRLASSASRALSTSSCGSSLSGICHLHSDICDGLRGDSFATASKAEAFRCGCLDAHLCRIEPGDLRDAQTNGLPVWSDFRSLADDGAVD